MPEFESAVQAQSDGSMFLPQASLLCVNIRLELCQTLFSFVTEEIRSINRQTNHPTRNCERFKLMSPERSESSSKKTSVKIETSSATKGYSQIVLSSRDRISRQQICVNGFKKGSKAEDVWNPSETMRINYFESEKIIAWIMCEWIPLRKCFWVRFSWRKHSIQIDRRYFLLTPFSLSLFSAHSSRWKSPPLKGVRNEKFPVQIRSLQSTLTPSTHQLTYIYIQEKHAHSEKKPSTKNYKTIILDREQQVEKGYVSRQRSNAR